MRAKNGSILSIITRVIRYDNLREQYWISSRDGKNVIENNFMDYNSIKEWIFTVEDINLANLTELEAGRYYIRVIVESRNREQLPVVGFFMHLIPEVEMSLVKESEPFTVGNNR